MSQVLCRVTLVQVGEHYQFLGITGQLFSIPAADSVSGVGKGAQGVMVQEGRVIRFQPDQVETLDATLKRLSQTYRPSMILGTIARHLYKKGDATSENAADLIDEVSKKIQGDNL